MSGVASVVGVLVVGLRSLDVPQYRCFNFCGLLLLTVSIVLRAPLLQSKYLVLVYVIHCNLPAILR